MQQKKVLIFGTRANPLSFFLSRSLNLRLNATNVYSVDTVQTREQLRLISLRDVYNCNELPDLPERTSGILQIVVENQITDVIDMRYRQCSHKTEDEPAMIQGLPADVNLITPIF